LRRPCQLVRHRRKVPCRMMRLRRRGRDGRDYGLVAAVVGTLARVRRKGEIC